MLRFCVSPVAILGDGKVEAVEIVRNKLVDEERPDPRRPTEERETIPCGIVLRSVGYRGVALPGVPFDEGRGTIPNDAAASTRRRPRRTAPAGSSAARAA